MPILSCLTARRNMEDGRIKAHAYRWDRILNADQEIKNKIDIALMGQDRKSVPKKTEFE